MKFSCLTAAAIAAQVAMASQALAQNGFNGAYAGAEISYADREFRTVGPLSVPENPSFFIDVDDEAVTLGGFVGWGALVSDNIYLGVELGLGSGGDESVHDMFDMTEDVSVEIEPQLRVGGAGRLGIVLGDANLAYAKLGYEMRKYEMTTSQGISDSDELGGVLYGVGFERLFGDRLSVRAEVSHVRVDADDNEFRLGVNRCGAAPCLFIPVRFGFGAQETRAAVGTAIRF